MTKKEAAALKSFKHCCTCGGHAYTMNGRPERQPHGSWCPQAKEYEEWYQALHGGVDEVEFIRRCGYYYYGRLVALGKPHNVTWTILNNPHSFAAPKIGGKMTNYVICDHAGRGCGECIAAKPHQEIGCPVIPRECEVAGGKVKCIEWKRRPQKAKS